MFNTKNCKHTTDGWCFECVEALMQHVIMPCHCSCHVEKWDSMHIVPCCRLTCQKYITVPSDVTPLNNNWIENSVLNKKVYLDLIVKQELEKIKCKKCRRNV